MAQHELSVYYSVVQPGNSASFHGVSSVAQTGKLRGEDRRGDLNGSRRSHSQNSIVRETGVLGDFRVIFAVPRPSIAFGCQSATPSSTVVSAGTRSPPGGFCPTIVPFGEPACPM